MRKALITGIAGQDGSYLAELLLADGYAVFGLARNGTDLKYVPPGVQVLSGDLADAASLPSAVQLSTPDEVYNVGGVTDLKTAFAESEMTWKVNYESVGALLDESLRVNPNVRFLQASSSEVFLPSAGLLRESSPRDAATTNPYAKAKLRADTDIIQASRARGVFACSAFLFNHESPRRSERSVIRKITRTLARIRSGESPPLALGNLAMQRDWGFAGDYARAMCLMLRNSVPEDFVVSSGTLHTIKEAIDIAAHTLGFDLAWSGEGVDAVATDQSGVRIVVVDPELYRPVEPFPKCGDSRLARTKLGWQPAVDFTSLVRMMAESDGGEAAV